MTDFLANLIPTVAHVLLHFLWQGMLIGLATGLALHALRRARPQVRYAVACLALLACVLVPLVTVITQLAVMLPELTLDSSSVQAVAASEGSIRYELFGFASAAVQFEVSFWIVAMWTFGTGIMLLRLMLGLTWVSRLCNSVQIQAQVGWQKRLDALALDFGLSRKVALRLVDNIDSPLAVGWWRPVVLLPAALITSMPVGLIEALLAHELAHIRRHDYLVNLLQNVVEALLFYHPVIWWLSHRIRIERELIADQLASEVIGSPRRLALALADLAEIQRTPSSLRLDIAQAANGGLLLSRIEALVHPVHGVQQASTRLVFCLLGLMAAFIASYAYAHVSRSGYQEHIVDSSLATKLDHAPDVKIRETFAILGNGGVPRLIWGPDDDLTAEVIARHGIKSQAIWARRNYQDYIITNPELVAQAARFWRAADALTLQMGALDLEMQNHQSRLMAINLRSNDMSAAPSSTNATDVLARDTRIVNEQLQVIGGRIEALRSEQEKALEQAALATHDLISRALAQGVAKRVTTQ